MGRNPTASMRAAITPKIKVSHVIPLLYGIWYFNIGQYQVRTPQNYVHTRRVRINIASRPPDIRQQAVTKEDTFSFE
jgi:hypothetical protein